MTLIYATGNPHKFKYGQEKIKTYGIDLIQKQVDVPEIQSTSSREIALAKAKSAFDVIKQPLVVNDASWSILALRGFPRPYMSSVETWLSTQDFLRLMQGHKNRQINLTEVLVYTDGERTQVFEDTVDGQILLSPDGESDFKSLDPIVSFRSDNKSLSHSRALGLDSLENKLKIWNKLGEWLKGNN